MGIAAEPNKPACVGELYTAMVDLLCPSNGRLCSLNAFNNLWEHICLIQIERNI